MRTEDSKEKADGLLTSSGTTILKQKPSTTLQIYAGWIAVLGSIVALILIQTYAIRESNDDQDGYFLGGLNWKTLIFNYHPVLMTTGFIFCGMNAILTFRLLPIGKLYSKTLHGALHLCGVTCISLGIVAVYLGQFKKNNIYNTNFPNFWSLHSYVGLFAIILYFQNFICGVLCFALDVVSIKFKKMYVQNHLFFGIVSLIVAVAAIVSGIIDLEGGEYGICPYDAEAGDTYKDTPAGCKYLDAFGMVVVVTLLFFLYAVLDFPQYQHIEEKDTSSVYK